MRGHHRKNFPQKKYHIADAATGCWNWIAAKDKNGYGAKKFNNRAMKAHRYMYEKLCGPIPEGMTLDHLCRNRACVNPAHLEPVTARINTRRGSNTRLTEAQVAEIRATPVNSKADRIALASKFGIHKSYLDEILRYVKWK